MSGPGNRPDVIEYNETTMADPPNKPISLTSAPALGIENGRASMRRGSVSRPDRTYLTEPRLGRIPWLIHGFGTAAWTEADFAKVREWNGFRPVILDQVHSDIIHCVDAPPDGRLEGDALITSAPGLFLVVKTADCLPVLVADETRRVVAAVHCGWRGTWKRILEQVVGELRARYGCDPGALLAALGPCIGPECYEVGLEVRERFEAARIPGQPFPAKPGRRRKIFPGHPGRELPRAPAGRPPSGEHPVSRRLHAMPSRAPVLPPGRDFRRADVRVHRDESLTFSAFAF